MIYFIQARDGGPIKIGTTVRLSERLKELARESGAELRVLAVVEGNHDVEQSLHARFSHLRSVGEWFEPGDDLTGFIVAEGCEWDGSSESATRKHTAMIRIDAETLKLAKLAASLMRISLADYCSSVLLNAADQDIIREAKKLI